MHLFWSEGKRDQATTTTTKKKGETYFWLCLCAHRIQSNNLQQKKKKKKKEFPRRHNKINYEHTLPATKFLLIILFFPVELKNERGKHLFATFDFTMK